MHFLSRKYLEDVPHWVFEGVRASVTVEVDRDAKNLVLQPGPIRSPKRGTYWVHLPPDWHVVDREGGRPLNPGRDKFWVSLDTFDPFHMVMQAPPEGGGMFTWVMGRR